MMHPPRRLGVGGALIILVWLLSLVVLLARTVPVSGDGIYYFVQLESIVLDGDVDFANNLERFRDNPHVARQLDSGVVTPTGRTPNLFSIGPAVVWAPMYLLARALPVAWLERGVEQLGSDRSIRLDLLAPSVATSVVVLVGLFAAYATCRRLGLGDRAAGLGVTIGFAGTSLLYYSTVEASMAHGIGFGVVSLLVYCAVRMRQNIQDQDRSAGLHRSHVTGWSWLGLGLLAGLAVLVRWQLVLVSLPVLVYTVWPLIRQNRPSVQPFLLAVGFLIGALPQLLLWKALYGQWLVIPQGSGFIVPTSPHFGEVLVSARHGLLTWTPLVVFGIAGLLIAARARLHSNSSSQPSSRSSSQPTSRSLALAAVAGLLTLILFLQVYINGSLIEWWGGEAFGARRFVDVAIVWMVGLAALVQVVLPRTRSSSAPLRWAVFILVALLIASNLTLMQLYRHGEIPRDQPVGLGQVVEALRR